MTSDRDHVYIRDLAIRHATAVRDWVCGTCGSKLTTCYYAESPNWRTVCSQDEEHDPEQFVRASHWAYLQHRQGLEAMEAEQVWQHLPEALRQAILARE